MKKATTLQATTLQQLNDVDDLIKKSLREAYAMYPDADLKIILMPLANILTTLAIASDMSKEEYLKSVGGTYDALKLVPPEGGYE